jgi:hypothetical protein
MLSSFMDLELCLHIDIFVSTSQRTMILQALGLQNNEAPCLFRFVGAEIRHRSVGIEGFIILWEQHIATCNTVLIVKASRLKHQRHLEELTLLYLLPPTSVLDSPHSNFPTLTRLLRPYLFLEPCKA